MRRWEERPIEVANLLNPAFCGRLLYQSIVGHSEYESKDMPYVLFFLVLPLVLHAPYPSRNQQFNTAFSSLAECPSRGETRIRSESQSFGTCTHVKRYRFSIVPEL